MGQEETTWLGLPVFWMGMPRAASPGAGALAACSPEHWECGYYKRRVFRFI